MLGSLCSNNPELCIVPWTLRCQGHHAFVHTISSASWEDFVLSDKHNLSSSFPRSCLFSMTTLGSEANVALLHWPLLWLTRTVETLLSHHGLQCFICMFHLEVCLWLSALGHHVQAHSRYVTNAGLTGLWVKDMSASSLTSRTPGQKSILHSSHTFMNRTKRKSHQTLQVFLKGRRFLQKKAQHILTTTAVSLRSLNVPAVHSNCWVM